MTNHLADMANAYGAVRKKLGSHRTEPHPEGLNLILASGLELLITYEAASRFRQLHEADFE
jgi:hypothetical protein